MPAFMLMTQSLEQRANFGLVSINSTGAVLRLHFGPITSVLQRVAALRRLQTMPKLSRNGLLLFGAGFGFVTGYANLICMARYSAFGTMMTGNILAMAKAFVETGMAATGENKIPAPLFFALIICSRHLGIFTCHLVGKHRSKRMSIMAPLILFIIASAETARYIAGRPLIPERWNVWFVAFCFGVQSSVTFPSMNVPTMLATGHLTNTFHTFMEVLLGEKPFSHLEKTAYPLVNTLAIFLGAAAGAAANMHAKDSIASTFLMTPITLLQVLLLAAVEHFSGEHNGKKAV